MAKRRKYKRTARRGGRVMTVTTSSRVVKTTRMNPRGLSLTPYTQQFTFGRGRHRESIATTHSTKNLRKMMRELFPSWTKAQHVERAAALMRMHHVAAQVWGRAAGRASQETFGRPFRAGFDYKVSGIGRDEYPERLKSRLRTAARAETIIDRGIHAHEVMAGKAALRRAGYNGRITDFVKGVGTNPRPSKTHIEFVIQGNYGYGWDDENTELTREDAKRSLREYRENGQGSYRLIRRRVKNDATNPRQYPAPKRARVVRYYRYGTSKDQVSADKPTGFMPLADAIAHAENYTAVPNRYAHVLTRGNRIVKSFKSKVMDGNNPHDPRTAETVRIPSVIRASIPAGSGSDPRRAETRRLRVVRVAAARSNPARLALRLSRATWRRLPKGDRRARGSVRFVRCKTSKRGAAHWLRCVVR